MNFKICIVMDNQKKFDEIFKEVFGIDDAGLGEHLNREEVSGWDSIHQLSLLSYLEDSFDIMLDGDDALSITSYLGCKDLLESKYKVEF